MNFVIDAGNTLIKTAVYDHKGRVAVDFHAQWQAETLADILRMYPEITDCLICATRGVPRWLPELMQEHEVRYEELSHLTRLPIGIDYETPETLGKDRIAAAVGAADRFPGKNVLAIDAGTAVTIDLVTAQGKFLGGNISPGLRMRFTALHQQTFSLPEVEPSADVPLLGRNTREAILAGVVNGLVYEIDQSIEVLDNKYKDLHVIMTGGDAPYLSARLKKPIFAEENLVLNGLNAILRNFSKQA